MLRALVAASFLASTVLASPGDEAVRESDLRATVAFLASPELEGRAAGERGGEVASAYLASRFEALGLLPAGDDGPGGRSWFQAVPVQSAAYDAEASSLVFEQPGAKQVRVRGFRPEVDRADSIEVSGALVMAPGELDPKQSLRDKVVVVDAGGSGLTAKRALAESLGATALLVVDGPDAKPRRELERTRFTGLAGAKPGIPVVHLDPGALPSDPAPSSVSIRLVYGEREERMLRNVVARLGSGRGLDGECVVLGAHWDHLGHANDVLHPGADDNASGVAALVAAAAALRAAPPRRGREVVLAGWTGEELGRLGSAWFVSHPLVPASRIAAAVNLDMLGRNNLDRAEYENVLQLIYSAGAPVLRELARQANEKPALDLRFRGVLRFHPVSDHASFAEAGIPIVYPFSGYHDDYHGAGDVPGKLSIPRIARSARYVARLVRRLAEHEGAIAIDPTIVSPPPPDPFETPYSR